MFSRDTAATPTVDGQSDVGVKLVAFQQNRTAPGGSDQDLADAQEQYRRAKQLFDQQDYPAAEKAFKRIVDTRRKRYETFQTRFQDFWGLGRNSLAYDHFGDPVEEDAIFMLAETQYARRHFTKSQDSYDDLLNRYPSTRHMDRVTRQLFRMAQYWLKFPEASGDTSEQSEIQLVSGEQPKSSPTMEQNEKPWAIRMFPNLTDKTRPVYGSTSRGLQALRSIWLHDSTGPLADDALMLSANHNLRIKNYVEAKRLYDLLREQYPDSPHIKDAYVLGSHVTLASYEGPEYDGAALEQARDLKQTMIQIFPDLSDEQRRRLQQEIDLMHQAEIERIWELVEFYQTKGTAPAIALHCNLLINRYPNSEYAAQAREVLRGLNQSTSNDQGMTLWPWAGKQVNQSSPQPNSTNPKTSIDKSFESSRDQLQPEKRSLFNFLRKAEEPPELRSTPAGRVSL